MRQPHKTIKNLSVTNIALFCAVTLLSLIAIDTALFFFTQIRFNWRKIPVETKNEHGSFYYIEHDPSEYLQLKTALSSSQTIRDALKRPDSIYIEIDVYARQGGLFSDRQKEAAIVGDSFTQGEGVADKETLGWFLGQEYKEYNFCNYGISGFNASSVCGIIYEQILPKKDRIKDIIYFYNINDIYDDWTADTITDFENIDYQNMPLPGFWKNSTILSLIKRAVLMRRETKKTVAAYLDLYMGDGIDLNTNINIIELLQTAKELKQLGINFHIVIYPLLHKDLLGNYPLAPIHKKLIRLFKEHNISCFDALDAFKDNYFMSRLRVNQADYHPNGKANRLVARFVKENIRLTD